MSDKPNPSTSQERDATVEKLVDDDGGRDDFSTNRHNRAPPIERARIVHEKEALAASPTAKERLCREIDGDSS